MDDKLTKLKEKQAEIGDKISVLQKTNKKKDEEAAEIRQLIAECRENLNRIKNQNSNLGSDKDHKDKEKLLSRISGEDKSSTIVSRSIVDDIPAEKGSGKTLESEEKVDSRKRQDSGERPDSVDTRDSKERDNLKDKQESKEKRDARERQDSGESPHAREKEGLGEGQDPHGKQDSKETHDTVDKPDSKESDVSGVKPGSKDSKPHAAGKDDSKESQRTKETLGTDESEETQGSGASQDSTKQPESSTGIEAGDSSRKRTASSSQDKSALPKKGERVSCKVDLNKMKVRIRGPSEDLKKLDATQLINLLEKFQCQELIINTGDETPQDPGEIRLMYLAHPGNLVMIAGLILTAFLFNANLNDVSSPFLLNLLFLSSLASHYGMVFWMTFIRCYTLKFGLNPDTYHLVDNIILPKYFSVCVLLSALSLYSFLATQIKAPLTSWLFEDLVQLLVLVMTFVMELTTISYFIPALIKLRHATDDWSEEEESETPAPPSYGKNSSKLAKLNWTMFFVNFLTLVFLGANIHYITNKLVES